MVMNNPLFLVQRLQGKSQLLGGALKNLHTVRKSRGRSSRCCGLAFYLSHSYLDCVGGWVGEI